MKHRRIMMQGTASSVGKSMLCTALCRIFTQDGFNVTPFKSQNMSLNSYVTFEGHEMGRAQVMQAEAARKFPSSKMNPILLKPTTDRKSQVILNGKVYKNMDAVDYFAFKPQLKEMVQKIFQDVSDASDIVVIEGAGSPAEINLKQNDIVNMGMAEIADAPVILIGDIDKGGVFASIVGTMMLLEEEEKKRVKGVIINKFRGSKEILEPGLRKLEEIIGIPVLGVVPYFHLNLEDEDSVTEWNKYKTNKGELNVCIIKLPHISNFTDFNILNLFEDVNVRFVELDEMLDQPDLIILPGTKNTIADIEALRESHMDKQVLQAYEKGSFIFGICGGFQILGQEIKDPFLVESEKEYTRGLGLLRTITEFLSEKTTTCVEGKEILSSHPVKGYEIHMGKTALLEDTQPFIEITKMNGEICSEMDGAVNGEATVFGTYIHGIFDSTQFTRGFINRIREKKGLKKLDNTVQDYWEYKENQYDALADLVRENIDMHRIYKIMREEADD